MNVNTPDELARARRVLAAMETTSSRDA
jgi:hypothetical protein